METISFKRQIKQCETCGQDIVKESNRNWNEYAKKRFCSRGCCSASQSKKKQLTCLACGVKFWRSPSHVKNKSYCSPGCRRNRITKPCEICGKITTKAPSQACTHWYCSHKCQGVAKRKHNKPNQGRRSPEDLFWKSEVLKAGIHQCALCGTDRRLEAHHIKPIKDFPELRHELTNGLCVCHECHYYKIHNGAPNYIHGKYSKKQSRQQSGQNISLEDRVTWLETQVKAQGRKVKRLEQSQQLSLFNLGG